MWKIFIVEGKEYAEVNILSDFSAYFWIKTTREL